MRFASRMERISLSGIRRVFEAAGPDAVNLGLGEPDFDTPAEVKRAARDAADEGFTSYTENRGIEELRHLVADRYNGLYGTSYGEDNVLITSGASEALQLAIQALVDPGKSVVFTDPGFVSYANLAALSGGVPRALSTSQGAGFVPDPSVYAELLTGDEAVLVLNSPCNPTGSVYPEKVVRALVEVSVDSGVPVLSDEVYDEFVYDGVHVTPATFDDEVLVANSFSKSFAMTGWRLGYLLGPPDAIEQCLRIHQYVQACAPSVSQAGGVAALREAEGFPREMWRRFRDRRDLLIDGLRENGLSCVEPRGAFYAFPDVSGYGGGDRVADALAGEGVLTVPGSAFGSHEGNLRLSYAASTGDLEAALGVMERVIPDLGREV
ncbi:MAG: Aromatic-amino-acid aminotransferase 2 [Methanonatronarchaeales archaeon]|nr:Aromatic-amino-acid aminotransferase 2 [Methanonatronarchaeales archaeon]